MEKYYYNRRDWKSLYSKLTGLIKYETLTNVTTDGNGGVVMNLGTQDGVPLAVYVSVSTARAEVVGHYNYKWVVQFFEFATGNIKKNANVGTVYVYYLER